MCNVDFKVIETVGETRYPYRWLAFCMFPGEF